MTLPRIKAPEHYSPEERREFFEKRGSPDPSPLESKRGYAFLLKASDIKDFVAKLSKPLVLDIGAGMGRFLMAESAKNPQLHYIGIDPDYQCVKKNLEKLDNRERRGVGLGNCNYFYGSVYHFFESLQKDCVDLAYVNYPDPWFKKRHLKRRLVTAKFFETFYPHLKMGAKVHVQTDIDDYAEFMNEEFKNLGGYQIEYRAHEHFEDLAGTLYQEKAVVKGHNRHCYLLTKLPLEA